MKILASISLCLYLIFAFACNKTETPQFSQTNLQTENRQILHSKFDKAILEVTSDHWGTTLMNGKIIDIRLFEDGIAEYDDYSMAKTKTKAQVKTEDVKVPKQTKISDEQLKDFIGFLSSDEFLSAKNKYTKKNCISYDAGRNIEIKFKYKKYAKQIEVIGYCDVLPLQISQLLEKLEKITNQRPT